MVKLTVKTDGRIHFISSGFEFAASYFHLRFDSSDVLLKFYVNSRPDDNYDIIVDLKTCHDVPVLVLNDFKIPLYKSFVYKDIEITLEKISDCF
jgi:hypothetical protein